MRPNLAKAQSTAGVDVEAELFRSTSKKEPKTGLAKSFLGLKSAAVESITLNTTPNTEPENVKPESQPVIRKPSVRRPILRAKTLPIENNAYQRVSLLAAGIKLPLNWGKGGAPRPPPKPFQTRLCDGCYRNITLTKIQYVCNDLECMRRLCDRCYRMWLDSKYRGHVIDGERLQKAHTAAEFRERCAKGMLVNKSISSTNRVKYIGEASSYELGHPFVDKKKKIPHKVGNKTDPSRIQNFNLEPLKAFFGKEEVEMTLRESSETKYSNITADVGPERFQKLPWATVDPFDAAWGWDYAAEKREAASAGRAEPALPKVEYQPPTTTPLPTSPARTIVSNSSITVESPGSNSPTTISNISSLTLSG
ncbi:hypothetical protein ABW20_dc0104831 [Dactylellina cionopaga]|nr:hypothetical protein ABW20_dc0104831 [Dactylellina cionopaga]